MSSIELKILADLSVGQSAAQHIADRLGATHTAVINCLTYLEKDERAKSKTITTTNGQKLKVYHL